MDELGNNIDGEGGKETIKAKPGDSGQLDMVVVAHSAAAESTGLPGEADLIHHSCLLTDEHS